MSNNLNAGSDGTAESVTTRRQFLRASTATTGGLVLAFNFPFMNQVLAQSAQGLSASEVNAWVVVNPDDSIVIRIARSEMGQGTLTGLAQLVTEELDGNWAKVSTEYPSPTLSLSRNRVWGNYATVGSRGIRESQDYVRKGGAAAKVMLIQAAADEWKVPAAECTSANSVITHTPSGRTVTYGKVATAASKLAAPTSVVLKLPKDWKLVGKRVARLDTVDKTNGTQIYGMDVTLPGMLNAAVKDCPVFGGKLKSFNASAITGRKGVKHVLRVSDSMVAVVADTWWQAKSALDVLPIEWDEGPNAQFSSTAFAAILKTALDAPEAVIGNQVGDSKKAIAESAKTIEAVYSYPHQNHATMESMNATVVFSTDAAGVAQRCQVWTPTQNAEAALAATSETSGLPAAKCEVYKMHLGGGFGRRGGTDWIIQAVNIAKQIPNTPIKMIWSREEDMLHGRYHPVTQCKLTAGLDAEGNVTGLHMRIAGQSILATVAPQTIRDGKDPVVFQGLNASGPEASIGYTFPNLLVDHAMRNPPVPAGFWRGVNLNQNAIYLECFVDEIAHATKQDPLALRRKLMFNHPKHLAVLNAVAAKVGWDKPAPKGVFRGIAQTMGYGSYVAACAEVSVSDAGVLKIHRIVASTDSGYVVNPQQIEAQVEGSFAYGLSAALYGECTVKNGRIEQTNFNNYPVVKMADMPAVETVMVPSGGFWGGVGEPTIAVAAPAVLNAIFAATGKRIRNLPLKDQSLRRA